MASALLAARLALALVFAAAAIAKLVDRRGSRQTLLDFGLPGALASPLVAGLGLAELAVATLLVPVATAWLGALGALALLLAFINAIAASMARGQRPDCHCFGQIHRAAVGWGALVRNGLLAIVAGVLVWRGWEGDVGPSPLAWADSASPLLLVAAGVALAGLGIVAVQRSPAVAPEPRPLSRGAARASGGDGGGRGRRR